MSINQKKYKSGRFVMRSQLDCHDSRLPGTGVFDIKTRACLPIRLDVLNYEVNQFQALPTARQTQIFP